MMLDKKAKVDIITRSKDRILLLRRAMGSILNQTFQDWRMILVNDGGNHEDITQLVREHEGRFLGRCIVIHNPTSLGMEAASNRGIKASDSPYIVIHDDDDSWNPKFLEECVEFLERNPYKTVGGVITYTIKVMERLVGDRIVTDWQEPYNTWFLSVHLARMVVKNMFPPISFLYKRSVCEEIGGYNEELPVLGDWDFNLRFLERYDIHLIPRLLANYHYRPSASQTPYGNSILQDFDKHMLYDTFLRNRMLRQDMKAGRIGLGYLVNFGRNILELQGELQSLNHQSPLGIIRLVRKIFNRISSKFFK